MHVKLSDFIKIILICVLKMNEGLMGLERHEGEYFQGENFHFWVNYPFSNSHKSTV